MKNLRLSQRVTNEFKSKIIFDLCDLRAFFALRLIFYRREHKEGTKQHGVFYDFIFTIVSSFFHHIFFTASKQQTLRLIFYRREHKEGTKQHGVFYDFTFVTVSSFFYAHIFYRIKTANLLL
jgi:hypothetical protein